MNGHVRLKELAEHIRMGFFWFCEIFAIWGFCDNHKSQQTTNLRKVTEVTELTEFLELTELTDIKERTELAEL